MSLTQEEIDALISSGALPAGAESEKSTQESLEGTTIPSAKTTAGLGETIYSPLEPKLEMLYDLQLPVSIELGRTNMLIRDILYLGRGSVIEFDKLVSEPVDVLVNGKKIAEGEVVVIDKHFGIRITTLVDPTERLKTLKK
ncbi:MAG: flagellar motor switch protein FliN [Candidatus Kapaibacteriota bacterium]|jgi:flagellar motor switch protein FliN/FliY